MFILAQNNGVKNRCSKKKNKTKKECDKDTDGTETGLQKIKKSWW